MATGTLPDAGQILNSLINSILLVDDDLAVHFATLRRSSCWRRARANCLAPHYLSC